MPPDTNALYQRVHDALTRAGVPASVLADVDTIFHGPDEPAPAPTPAPTPAEPPAVVYDAATDGDFAVFRARQGYTTRIVDTEGRDLDVRGRPIEPAPPSTATGNPLLDGSWWPNGDGTITGPTSSQPFNVDRSRAILVDLAFGGQVGQVNCKIANEGGTVVYPVPDSDGASAPAGTWSASPGDYVITVTPVNRPVTRTVVIFHPQ